jgi:hypothetical protein
VERSIELGFCEEPGLQAFEMHDILKGNESRARMSFETAGLDTNLGRELGTGWLEAAAAEYNISRDIRDYVITPVIMFPTALPNRNGVAFSLASMGRFDLDLACLGYETWKRRPTHFNHVNDDPTNAKGAVFDTRMLPLAGTNQKVWKAVALYGCDRTRDPVLANNILTGEYSHYSMGASVGSYECAVCGHRPTKAQNGCEHISLDNRTMRIFNTPDRGPVLAHYICDFIRGFELSCVHPTPAWAAAHVSPEHLLHLGDS